MGTTPKHNFLQQFFLSKSKIKPSLQTLPLTVPETSLHTLITNAQTQTVCRSFVDLPFPFICSKLICAYIRATFVSYNFPSCLLF